MVTTPAELAAMEKFFSNTPLPKQLKLNAAVMINDLPGYVQKIMEGIKTGAMSDAVAAPRWDDLQEIRKVLNRKSLD